MNNGRIRHATETFVNNLIDGVKALIKNNTDQINNLSTADTELLKQINVLSGEVINSKLPQPTESMDIRSYLALLKKNEAYYVAVKQEYPLLTNIPADIQDSFSIKISGGVVYGVYYYAKVQIASLTSADSYYECSIYNNTEFSGWTKFSTTTKTDILAKLKNNWTLRGGFYASKVYKNGNHISGNLTISGGIYTAGTIIIEQLPWKPNVNMQFPCSRYNAGTVSWESIVGEIDTAGNVKCSAGWKANDHIVLHLEYDIEG